MNQVNIIGIDLAKTIFYLHGMDKHGKEVFRKKLQRKQLAEYIRGVPPCVIGMEACSSSHYWARVFSKMGHQVKLISPQYVKPYVRGNKNDRWDAEAIAEAVSRPRMRFVALKTVWDQEIQSLHRVRERYVKAKTATRNEIRGLLMEYGIVLAKGISPLKRELPILLEDQSNELTPGMREIIKDLLEELRDLEIKVKNYDRKLHGVYLADERCQRITEIEGVGVITATAVVAACGFGRGFKNGRQFSAWLGLVPRQNSSGGKERLLGISKRGNNYLRKLLVHGARSVLKVSPGRSDYRSRWIEQKKLERGWNKACVALANKNARIIWALLAKGETYRKAA